MKLGIGLPNTLYQADRRLMLESARMADQAGFHALGTIDRPAYDGWEPLITLAGVAAVTERIRLATTIMHLPNRNEILTAKHVATLDVLSEGRVDLGIAVGWSQEDYELLDADFTTRGDRCAEQVERMREFWVNARASTREKHVPGPAPVQDPPPIWMGGGSPPAMARAIEHGDGFIFGGSGAAVAAEFTPQIRERAAAAGKPDFPVAGLAYVAVGDDPAKALELAAPHFNRYYGGGIDPAKAIIAGPPEAIAEALQPFAEAGLDLFYLFAELPDPEQVARLGEGVLPAFA